MESLQKLLGIDLPIIQGPMAGVQGHALTTAVCNAGGLGSLPCAMLTPEVLRKELEQIRAGTDKPYNVNFFAHTPPEPDATREAAWRTALAPYYREFGIDADTIPTGPGRAPFTAEAAELLSEFKPPVVSFHFGLPSAALIARVRSWGAKVLSSATTVAEARWLEEQGVDAIIAQGLEAGGHRGFFLSHDISTQLGTFALLPQIVRAVNIPVIAAGVQIGTAYMLTPEATTSAIHRAVLKSDAVEHTALTNLFTGGPARGVVNRLMRELGSLSPAAPAFPLATSAIAPLRSKAESLGSGDFSPLWSGQNARGCKEIPAAELTRELAAGW